jgi:hypothetical protein
VAALAAAEFRTWTGYMSVYWASNAASAACSAPVVHQLKISTCPETAGALVELLPQPALNATAPTNAGNHSNRPMSIHTARCEWLIHVFTSIGKSVAYRPTVSGPPQTPKA